MANYTMYLYEVIEVWGSQDPATDLASQIPELNDFPAWTNSNKSYNMLDMFQNRFYYREICAETIEYWTHLAKRYIKELLVKYGNLIELQLDNLNKLYDRFTTHTNTETEGVFLNPINQPGTILGGTAVNGQLQGYTEGKYEEDKAFGYFRTNPEIMEAANKLEMLYNKVLDEMDRLFMGVL